MIRIIAMLTHDDQTVENALEVYEASKQVKTPCWGFKDININAKDAKILSSHILRDKKEFYFESLVSSEEGALKIAKLAITEIGLMYME